ncbi:holin family protein [Paracoccus sp. P2]|mgnify:CR=1 FL=1|uniref:Holin (3TMs family) n=2 Tax=Paracoccus pantotrophus TaxID=82367 RepID=A0A1I5DI81_PARPN|nr:holin family protein [Paracoccus pantotrophus]MDF3853954.1 holin family protein [Paracoccus pantotrophus]QLH13387.1 holin family protein [Paracoccus pantotrophus]RKS44668.1 holin (3TMs family) [Paracoccus pantotrophus]SFN98908.1 Holin of 3TMs, for gene-transfer release [Paracoccus pantotrophus]
MGLMDRFLGASGAVTTMANAATGVAEVFRENATRRMELDEEAYARAIAQLSGEFAAQPRGWFDAMMNGLNRLPRPMMTLGTVGLFTYAMADPEGFGLRMENLNLVPEPLWWLLGAIISFYFGAREAHYFRSRPVLPVAARKAAADAAPAVFPAQIAASGPFEDNAALRDWAAAGAAR